MKITQFKISDFDQTITKHHTFNNRSYTPANNIKSGIEDAVVHQGAQLSAIATYHNDPNYVASYVSHILGKELKLKETINEFDHDVLSIYAVDGEEDFIISTLKENNFGYHLKAVSGTGKNTQINHILDYVKNAQKHSIEKHDVFFYDDSTNNYRCARYLGINSTLVDGGSSQFKASDEFKAPQPKIKAPQPPVGSNQNSLFATKACNNNNDVPNNNNNEVETEELDSNLTLANQ